MYIYIYIHLLFAKTAANTKETKEKAEQITTIFCIKTAKIQLMMIIRRADFIIAAVLLTVWSGHCENLASPL